MRYPFVFALAGVTALYATASFAADMGPYIPPPTPSCIPRGSVPPGSGPHPPFCAEEFSGWYLRGDIGMTNQAVGQLDNALYPGTANLVIRDKNFEAGMLFGVGIGYRWNSWLRTDVTGEYRGETGFHGLDTWTDGGGLPRYNNYTAKKSEWLFLANAYVDLGTWWHITPFVGAGIGFSRNTISSFRDQGIAYSGGLGTGYPTLGYAKAASTWNFAWALYAGLGYQVNKDLTVELAYRYVDLGNAKSGDLVAFDGTNTVDNPMEFNHITSQDVKLGVRWNFDTNVYEVPTAVYRPPAPAYRPPEPAYQQPSSIYTPPQPYYPPPIHPRG